MKPIRTGPATFLLAVLALLFPVRAHAASNRVFLGLNGNDSNDCANTLTPCLTFAGALAQVNPGGRIIAQATGGYGALTITSSVTVSGAPGVTMYTGRTVTVNAPGATVVLRNLTIEGAGSTANGVHVIAVGSLHLESCVIAEFAGDGNTGGSGVAFFAAGQLFVKDTCVRANGWTGIWVVPSSGVAKASIDNCRLEANAYGVFVTGNNSGTSTATISGSVLAGSTASGAGVQGAAELNMEQCAISNGNIGINSQDTSIVRVSNSTITANSVGLLGPGSLLSRGNNTVEGNTTNGSFSSPYLAK
jgi:hypothetical protein